MARQQTLAEILADDTGRIRPEVADLLMEPLPARPRPRPQQGPIPRPHPRPHPGGAPIAPPRYFGPGLVVLAVILFVAVLALIIPRDHEPDKTTVSLEHSQSKEAGVLVTPQEIPPIPPIAEEKFEKDQTESIQAQNIRSGQSDEEPVKDQQEQYGPCADPVQQTSPSDGFFASKQPEQEIKEADHSGYTNPSLSPPATRRNSTRAYAFRLHRYRSSPRVGREWIPYQMDSHSYRRDFNYSTYARQRARLPRRIYSYTCFPPLKRFYVYPYPDPYYRRKVIVYWPW